MRIKKQKLIEFDRYK